MTSSVQPLAPEERPTEPKLHVIHREGGHIVVAADLYGPVGPLVVVAPSFMRGTRLDRALLTEASSPTGSDRSRP